MLGVVQLGAVISSTPARNAIDLNRLPRKINIAWPNGSVVHRFKAIRMRCRSHRRSFVPVSPGPTFEKMELDVARVPQLPDVGADLELSKWPLKALSPRRCTSIRLGEFYFGPCLSAPEWIACLPHRFGAPAEALIKPPSSVPLSGRFSAEAQFGCSPVNEKGQP